MAYKRRVCPKPLKRLEKEIKESDKWTTKWACAQKFEVGTYSDKFVVNLKTQHCSCNWWGLIGLPCRHAYACIFYMEDEPKKYVSKYYPLSSFMDCYSPVINLINGENLWHCTKRENIIPSRNKRPLGRLRTLRRREPTELEPPYKLCRIGTSLKCSKY